MGRINAQIDRVYPMDYMFKKVEELTNIIENELIETKVLKKGNKYPVKTIKKLRTYQAVRGAMIGDSITKGVMDGETEITYGRWLKDTLGVVFTWTVPDITLINKGVPGERSDQGLARFTPDVLNNNPDFVIIMFGTNDVLQYASFDVFETSLTEMVESSLKNDIEVVLMTILPIFIQGHENVGIINNIIKKVANKYEVCLVDLNEDINNLINNQRIAPLDLLGDGVHPKWDREYKLISDSIIKQAFYPQVIHSKNITVFPAVKSKMVMTDNDVVIKDDLGMFKRSYLLTATGGTYTGSFIRFHIYNDEAVDSKHYIVGNKYSLGGKVDYLVNGVNKGELDFYNLTGIVDYKFPIELEKGLNIVELKREFSGVGDGGGYDIAVSGFGVQKIERFTPIKNKLTLINGWKNADENNPAFYTITPNGKIEFGGLISKASGGISTDGTGIIQLNTETTPNRFVSVLCSTEQGSGNHCNLYLDSNGYASIQGFVGTNWLSLDNVSFYK